MNKTNSKLDVLAGKRDAAYNEYDALEVSSRNGVYVSMADLIQASNKAGSAFMAWSVELNGGVK